MTEWEELIELCRPPGMKICNCKQAYVKPGPTPGTSEMCESGCSANQCEAKIVVARDVLSKRSAARTSE